MAKKRLKPTGQKKELIASIRENSRRHRVHQVFSVQRAVHVDLAGIGPAVELRPNDSDEGSSSHPPAD